MGKTISHCQGKGSIAHNNRLFKCKNVDPERTKDNITFVKQSVGDAYEHCFGEAVKNYNDKQKRKDRRVDENYFRELFGRDACNTVCTGTNKQKSFYEDLVQVGDMNDSGIGTADAEKVKAVLIAYWQGFQERNPNLYVFNSVLHMDEATPHLHIDWIPLGHYKRGLSVQNGLAQALKEQGFGDGINAVSRWRESERQVLEAICKEHGIEVEPPKKSRGSLSVEAYKELKDIEKQIAAARSELSEINDMLDQVKALKNDIEHPADVLNKAKPKRFHSDIAEVPYNVLRDCLDTMKQAKVDAFDLRGEVCSLKTKIKSLENTNNWLRDDLHKYKQKARDYDKAMAYLRETGQEAQFMGYKIVRTVAREVTRER